MQGAVWHATGQLVHRGALDGDKNGSVYTALACNPFKVRAVPDVPVKGKF